jgi:hypothetical protein
LTSEIRHETSDAEIRHFATLLNSGDTATLLPGIRHAQLKSVGVHVRKANRMFKLRSRAASICFCHDARSKP